MSILQDFYHGEVLPWEQFGSSSDPIFKMYSNNISKLETELLENMTEKDQKVFSELKHLSMTRNIILSQNPAISRPERPRCRSSR